MGLLLASSATAVTLDGDLDGNGTIDPADESLLEALYGAVAGDGRYDPAADTNDDGRIDYRDLAQQGAGFGATGGYVDSTPPGLLVTLDDIPDDMNDLLVVPPSGFQVTLLFDSEGGSLLDTSSISVTSPDDLPGHPAGSELAGEFGTSPTRSVWEIPSAAPLELRNYTLDVRVSDLAGNEAASSYAFAVRPFAYGAPMGDPQVVFLDFDQDRSLAAGTDFIEDLREFGLSSSTTPAFETAMRDRLVSEIVARVYPFYGRNPDGSPGPDPVNVVFVASEPGPPRARLCVGGESALGAAYLGATTLDVHNLDETQDECGATPLFGVFPHALDNLWSLDPSFQSAFAGVDPGVGGTPAGEHGLDAVVLDPGFDPGTASASELARWNEIEDAVDAFAQAVATATAHELGHSFGLVAHGAAPAGLWGGGNGGKTDHNVTTTGAVPTGNYLMNPGASFSFDALTGRNGVALPVFRPLGWAYLRDRVALSSQVTGLFPPPTLDSVEPNPVSYAGQTASVTLRGDGFYDDPSPPLIELATPGDPTPNPVLAVQVVDAWTITGVINKFQVPAALYDVRLINPDGQETTLVQGLDVQ